MGYSIKVLSSDEFDKLPFSHASIAMGLADPKEQSVYVRQTYIQELNKYLLDHEVDHLVEEVGTDEIDGIRYKIPLIGPLISGIGAGIAGKAAPAIATSFLPGAAGKIAGFGGLLGKGAGFLGSGLASGAKGLGNFLLPGKPFGGGAPGSISVLGGQLSPSQLARQRALSGLPGQQFSGLNPPPGGSGLNQQFLRLPTRFGPPSLSASTTAPVQNAQKSVFDMFKSPQAKLGSSLLTAGLGKRLPQAPPLPPSIDALRSQIASGGGPLGQAGRGELQQLLGQEYNPLSEPEIQAALRQLELDEGKAVDQVRDLYRNLRPGSDPSSDTSFRRDLQEVQDQFARAKADTLATRTRDTEQNFKQQRLLQIQQALGADSQDMANLFALAQLDVQQIMAQLQIDFASAQHFKETFTNLGSQFLLNSAGVNPLLNFNLGNLGGNR